VSKGRINTKEEVEGGEGARTGRENGKCIAE